MTIPTVRVANPADPGSFMTINAADFGEAHELWPDQAEGFEPAGLARPVARLGIDPAVRDLAAEIMTGLTAARLDLADEDWTALSGERQLAALRDAEADVDDLLAIRQVRRLKPYEPDPADKEERPVSGYLRVAKGPRGLWYVVRGDERISKGFPDEAAAASERARLGAGDAV